MLNDLQLVKFCFENKKEGSEVFLHPSRQIQSYFFNEIFHKMSMNGPTINI